MSRIRRAEGRRLFGADPAGYDRVRPAYPDWVFNSLTESGALFAGANTLEIGPGNGLATRNLLAHGAGPITLVEPDERLANWLASALAEDPSPEASKANSNVIIASFEEVELPDEQFDLVVAATMFHWLDAPSALEKIRRVLKPGGTLALIWNVFQQLDVKDGFHDATTALLSALASSPSGAPDTLPYALDRGARDADLHSAGFNRISYEESRWPYTISSDEVRALYAGFSPIQRLPASERAALLEQLVDIADCQFGGTVTRNMTTCLYHCRRPEGSE